MTTPNGGGGAGGGAGVTPTPSGPIGNHLPRLIGSIAPPRPTTKTAKKSTAGKPKPTGKPKPKKGK